MKVNRQHRSPHYTDVEIDVSHIVVHGTGVDATRSLQILTDGVREVSAHLLIDRDGSIFELVPCLGGATLRAWHAGVSRFFIDEDGKEKQIQGFNDFSIGIELVNLNGNIFSYTEEQYASLSWCVTALGSLYKALRKPENIVGHEHIAGFRGKVDPGRLFDWNRLYGSCFVGQPTPQRTPRLPVETAGLIAGVYQAAGYIEHPTGPLSESQSDFCQHLSSMIEGLLNSST